MTYRMYTDEQRQAMKEHGNDFHVFGEYFDIEVKYLFNSELVLSGWMYYAPFEGIIINDDGNPWSPDLKPSLEHLKSILHASIDRMKVD